MTTQKKTLLVVFLSIFMDLLGFGIIIPVQPFYAKELGASATVVTLLGASYSLMQFLFAPFWGRLSDRVGRRPVMLASIAASTVGYTLFGSSHSLIALFAARSLAGFGGANLGTAQAIVADSTGAENRAKGMGIIGAAFGLGFTLGPAIGGFFVKFGLSAPAYLAAGLSAINWALAFWLLPETYPAEKRVPGRSGRAFSFAALKHAARHTNVGRLLLFTFIFTSAFSLLEQVLGLFIESTWVRVPGVAPTPESFKHAAALTAYVLTAVGITATIMQGGLIGRLARRFGEGRLLRVGSFLVAVGLFLVPWTGRIGPYWLLIAVSSFIAAGTGMSNPSLVSYVSQLVDATEQGGVLGLCQSLAALGRVLGPSAAGALFEANPELPFWVASALTLVCVAIVLTLPGRVRIRQPANP